MMKQICLITDGCSNVGMNPAAAAAHAYMEGIVVNVIGVVDQGELGLHGAREVEEIASAGGGMHRIVPSWELRRTVQMMTRQTVAMTVRQAVSQKLKAIVGSGDVEDLPPEKRAKVVEIMDEMSEKTPLRVALVIDTSASMKPKLHAVEEAIRDLMLSLEAREGKSELCVFHFPGTGAKGLEAELDVEWTDQLAKINNLFYKLNMRGATPTGPAIMQAVQYFGCPAAPLESGAEDPPVPSERDESEGMLRDYVI